MEGVYLEIWNEIKNQAIYIPQAVIITALFFMSYMFISDNKGQVRKRLKSLFKQKWIVAFLGYAAFLSSATIIARFRSQPIFSGIGTFGIIRNGKLNKEILINILLFIPYTFLYSKSFDSRKTLISSFLLSLCTSAFIELFQFVFWVGQGTIADVVHNVIGGLIGYSLWYLVSVFRKSHLIKETNY